MNLSMQTKLNSSMEQWSRIIDGKEIAYFIDRHLFHVGDIIMGFRSVSSAYYGVSNIIIKI